MSSPGPLAVFASLTRLHIVAIAALGTLTFGWIFTGTYPWLLVGICASDWFVVNLLNRVVDLEEDAANAIVGTGFAARHRASILAVGFGTLAASFVWVYLVCPEIIWLRLAYHTLGLTYNWPLLPGGHRIKALYFWKNTASAMGFMITVFAYPLATAGWGAGTAEDVSALTVLFAAAFFFPFELSYEVIYDLRDARGDAAAGVRTYPVVHGVDGAVRIIDGLLFLGGAALAIGWVSGVVPWRLFIMIVAPALQLLLYKRALRAGITSRFCVGLTWFGAALLATYHVWYLAELPGSGLP